MPKKTIAGLLGEEIEAIQPTVAKTRKIPTIKGSPSTIRLKDIKPRHQDTRPIDEEHGRALLESIKVLGLIEPIVTDSDGVLLAGGHRHWALNKLIVEHPENFENHFPGAEIPVHRLDFKAADNPKRALEIEVGENEHRRDYKAEEIKDIIERLKAAGYKELKGRPKTGEKSVMDAVSHIIGKSKRRIQVILKEADESANNDALSETDERDRHLKAAIAALEKWQGVGGKGRKKRETALAKELPAMIERLQEGLK